MPQLTRIGKLWLTIVSFFFVILMSGCQPRSKAVKLTIFHAGSLAIPFRQMEIEFEKATPNVDIQLEASGSVTAIRKIVDLNRDCDIIALADADLIDEWLIPDYVAWNMVFASNEIVIAYRPESKYSESIRSDNWYEIIHKPDVSYGRSDPNSDPCGYRTVMCLKLADSYYPNGVDYESILKKDNHFIRPKASDLVALLETQSLDYIFEYSSVAKQHGFEVLYLPDSINLSNPMLDEVYKNVGVEITGKKPGEIHTVYGISMRYGVSILETSHNAELAEKFVQFICDPEKGLKILSENGQKTLAPRFTLRSKQTPVF